MKNTFIFLSVIISAVLTWFAYAFVAALISENAFNDCLSDNTVITFFFFTGWILPALVGYDQRKLMHRKERIYKQYIKNEVRQIRQNTFGGGSNYHASYKQVIHLN